MHWQGVMVDISDAKAGHTTTSPGRSISNDGRWRTCAGPTRSRRRSSPRCPTTSGRPLSAILGNALTLEEGDRLGITEEERKQLIHSLAAKARRLNTIVTDLLDTERLARGVVEPKLQEIAVGRLISLLVWDSEAMAGRQVHVDTRSVSAWVDPQMISRIVENLLMNAARHTPSECQVWVKVLPEGDHVLIEVEDDGPGIPRSIERRCSSRSSTGR